MAAPATLSSNTPVAPQGPKGSPASMAPPRLRPKPQRKGGGAQPSPTDQMEQSAKQALRVLAVLVALGLLYMISDRVVAAVTRWPATIQEAVAPSHCQQFIHLAKTAYGENWRVRLDPRDTTCDHEVKTEWERQKLTRYTPPVEPLVPPAAQVAVAPSAAVTAVAASAPATFCLNVVSLAKARYGEAWRSKLTGAEAKCAGAPADATSQTVSQGVTTP